MLVTTTGVPGSSAAQAGGLAWPPGRAAVRSGGFGDSAASGVDSHGADLCTL
jgi:hypothetical protein